MVVSRKLGHSFAPRPLILGGSEAPKFGSLGAKACTGNIPFQQ